MAAADVDEDDLFIGGDVFAEVGEGVDRCEAVFVPLVFDCEAGGHGLLELGELFGRALHELEEAEVRVVGVLEVGFV